MVENQLAEESQVRFAGGFAQVSNDTQERPCAVRRSGDVGVVHKSSEALLRPQGNYVFFHTHLGVGLRF